ncbi:MAG: pentapeptide repeat-containing protein [Sulfurimonas sp.]|nr:pentapeptide repeat-containing protein [Sulfurimonas sp.]
MKIARWDNGEIIYDSDCNTWRELLKNAVKNKISFYRANLQNSNFSNLDLSFANFTEADLQDSNFSGADLECVKFYDANLRGAYFSNAILRGADLLNANLECANFVNVDFRRTMVINANLTNANLSKSDLTDIYLRNAKGIDYFKEYSQHKSYILFQENQKPIIRIGSVQGTIEEWDKEFSSNDSKDSIDRLECYKIMMNDYEEFKNKG